MNKFEIPLDLSKEKQLIIFLKSLEEKDIVKKLSQKKTEPKLPITAKEFLYLVKDKKFYKNATELVKMYFSFSKDEKKFSLEQLTSKGTQLHEKLSSQYPNAYKIMLEHAKNVAPGILSCGPYASIAAYTAAVVNAVVWANAAAVTQVAVAAVAVAVVAVVVSTSGTILNKLKS